MRFGAEPEGASHLRVFVPCYRSDILHDWDIFEDAAIAYGFENFDAALPPTSTTAEEHPGLLNPLALLSRRKGVVNRVVPVDRLRVETDELATSLAAKPVSLLRTTKRQVQEATENMVSTQSGWTASAHLAVAMADPEARAAASAYLAGGGGR